ncbi:hypothetical protein OPT61_g7885 [Boeremia exigua]|uniref:Uncharacterized protein n=1 Tax=Boeremia exigua TaxID=749465 RepID=A0ACC2I1M3_9PLEO|nr:hypothetical protein OPT61_g7885 [Boeremia exigua]
MAGPRPPLCISEILSTAIAEPDNASSSTEMSQVEEIAELRFVITGLKAEKIAAVERAARRHMEMMHANRRAERAEQALKHESKERLDDQMKAFSLFCSYKATIKDLEAYKSQALQDIARHENLQRLHAADAASQAAFTQQKESMVQAQSDAQKTIQGLEEKIKSERMQARREAEQLFKQQAAAMSKRVNEYSSKAEEKLRQLQNALQSANDDNTRLKKELQKALQAVEWHKTQKQQRTAQHGTVANRQMPAGIHAGIPLPPQPSLSQGKVSPKRIRRDSLECSTPVEGTYNHSNVYGDASSTTPDRRSSGGKSRQSHRPTSTPTRKKPDLSKGQVQSPQCPVTPTRQMKTVQPHQRLNSNTHALQLPHQSQSQAQNRPLQMPMNQFEQNLLQSIQKMDAHMTNTVLSQVSNQNAITVDNNDIARMQSFGQAPDRDSTQPIPQQQATGVYTPDQRVAVQAGAHSLYMPASNPMQQSTFAPWQTNQPQALQQVQSQYQSQQQQQQQQPSYVNPQFHGMPNQAQNNVMPMLTSSHNPGSASPFPDNAVQVESTPFQMNGGTGNTSFPNVPSSQHGAINSTPYLGGFQSTQDETHTTHQTQAQAWDALMAPYTAQSSNANTPFPLTDMDFLSDYNTTASTDLATPSGPQQYTIDPSPLFSTTTTQTPDFSMNIEQLPNAELSTSLQQLLSEALSVPETPPAANHPAA